MDTVWFPIIDITNYYRLSGLQHHKFIFWQFRRSEVLKSGCWHDCVSSGSSRVNLCSWLFHLLEAHSLIRGPFLHLQSISLQLLPHISLFSDFGTPAFLLYGSLWLHWAHLGDQGQYSHLTIINHTCKIPLPFFSYKR